MAPLDEKKARFGKLCLRQQFAEHRSNASCAGCHAFLDPIGFAFENYDAVGRWRTEEKSCRSMPVAACAADLQRPRQLRAILVRDMAGQFTKNLAENLMTYALGRGLEYSDKPGVQAVLLSAGLRAISSRTSSWPSARACRCSACGWRRVRSTPPLPLPPAAFKPAWRPHATKVLPPTQLVLLHADRDHHHPAHHGGELDGELGLQLLRVDNALMHFGSTDTRYSIGFSELGFKTIKPGMDGRTVYSPIKIPSAPAETPWKFSALPQGDAK